MLEKFRVTPQGFNRLLMTFVSVGRLVATCQRKDAPTARFRLGCCLYFIAHRGEPGVKADACGIGHTTLRKYLNAFCSAVIQVLQPTYMSKKPPPPEKLQSVRAQFASRRGIGNVGLAVDGTHVPYHPECLKTATTATTRGGRLYLSLPGATLITSSRMGMWGRPGVLGTTP